MQRFRVRTFITIDLALITLGISRTLFLILDPWGQSGFCKHYACIVVSRLLGSLAFPGLTASYTLVFITLWISARIRLRGKSWIQKLKVLVPLCFIHFGVAILFEIIVALPFLPPKVVAYHVKQYSPSGAFWSAYCLVLLGPGFCALSKRALRVVPSSARTRQMSTVTTSLTNQSFSREAAVPGLHRTLICAVKRQTEDSRGSHYAKSP